MIYYWEQPLNLKYGCDLLTENMSMTASLLAEPRNARQLMRSNASSHLSSLILTQRPDGAFLARANERLSKALFIYLKVWPN